MRSDASVTELTSQEFDDLPPLMGLLQQLRLSSFFYLILSLHAFLPVFFFHILLIIFSIFFI
jgi:hypothetical protein